MPEVIIKTAVKFEAWIVPNFVRQENRGSSLSLHVKDVSQEVIDALAADWLRRVYENAGKKNPFKATVYR